MVDLGKVLERRGDWEKAEQVYRVVAATGDIEAMAHLAALLEDEDN